MDKQIPARGPSSVTQALAGICSLCYKGHLLVATTFPLAQYLFMSLGLSVPRWFYVPKNTSPGHHPNKAGRELVSSEGKEKKNLAWKGFTVSAGLCICCAQHNPGLIPLFLRCMPGTLAIRSRNSTALLCCHGNLEKSS